VHGRDQDDQHHLLSQKHVAIIGVGSLGSEVAMLLSQSGVGRLTLVDGETLAWANISRHRLGASSVGMKKVHAIKQLIGEMLPHVKIEVADSPLTLKNQTLIHSVMSANLVISATGNWGITALLNIMQLDAGKKNAMLVSWMEAHAIAAHSILLTNEPSVGCLQCGFNANGRPMLEVTKWDQDPICQVPACGGVFMPYGPIGLSRAATMTAEHSIDALCGRNKEQSHRIWIGNKDQLQRAGGKWSQDWVSIMGDPESGGFQTARNWPIDAQCRQCQLRTP